GETLLKAMRSRELDAGAATPWQTLDHVPDDVHPWFRAELDELRRCLAEERDLLTLKRSGFSDADIAEAWGTEEAEIRRQRVAAGIRPAYRRVDSCAGEVEAASHHYYSAGGEADEARRGREDPRRVILGTG